MKKFSIILFLMLFLGFMPNVFSAELTILHTSDIHGRVFPLDYNNMQNLGGLSKQVTLFKDYHKSAPNLLILDSGDYYQGSVFNTIYRWKYSPKYLQLANYDVVGFGNHEFDNGLKVLKKYLQKSKTKYISTNLKFNDKYFAKNVKPYKLFEINGERILVLAIVTPDLANLTDTKGLEIQDTESVLKEYIKNIPHDMVILISHSGLDFDCKIAQNVSGINIILGGHDHILAQKKINDTWIFHTGEYGIFTDKIVYDTSNSKISQNYIVLDKNISNNSKVDNELEKLNKIIQKSLNKELFYTSEELDGSKNILKEQTNLGKLILKSFVDYFDNDFDIAFLNSGSVRINKKLTGNITLKDAYEILPFNNNLVKVLIDGKILKNILKRGQTSGNYYLQVYSKFDLNNIDEDKMYKLVTLDYLYNGGDGYTELKNTKIEKQSEKCSREIFINYLTKINKIAKFYCL